MPDERAAFLSALREQPDDVTTSLVFADWLEEHGDAGDVELAAFIRLEIRCDALDPDDLSEAARSQRDRAFVLKTPELRAEATEHRQSAASGTTKRATRSSHRHGSGPSCTPSSGRH